MSDVNQKIMERSSGNLTLNPDEQRYYLGTFGERVIFTINNHDIGNDNSLSLFSQALTDEKQHFNPIKVKISSQISEEKQMTFMKLAKEMNLSATIIDEKLSTSPFGIVVYTDHAVNRVETDLFTQYQKGTTEKNPEQPKKGFFKKLFGK